LEYSPVLLMLVSGGACDFFTTFRMGIFALRCDLEVKNQFEDWVIGRFRFKATPRGSSRPQLSELHP
jgi:hypothetical protein